jgi:hypothetical protein
MQFYIIDPDPATNARNLPAYALRVNIREGWQILSDIGHRFGVKWAGQNKAYNPLHPLTRSFSNQDAFVDLWRHYGYCLTAYIDRNIGKRTVWHDAFDPASLMAIWETLPTDCYGETRVYLATTKAAQVARGERKAKATK